ncbi:UNVERIFIED_CONTAM: hypothetical protein O8I53_08330 [Campylobacter lari]
MKSSKSKRVYRTEIINVIYQYELLNKELKINDIFESHPELNNEQFHDLEKICKNYVYITNIIKNFLRED